METATRLVEFLLAYDDRTWDTTIEAVPEHVEDLEGWAGLNLGQQERFRKVVLFAVYSEVPYEGKD